MIKLKAFFITRETINQKKDSVQKTSLPRYTNVTCNETINRLNNSIESSKKTKYK